MLEYFENAFSNPVSRSVSRRQVVGVNTGKRFRFSQLQRSYLSV